MTTTRAALRPLLRQPTALLLVAWAVVAVHAQTLPSAISGIAGMDFSRLSPTSQGELATVFTDEFCYCGCPHTLETCLKSHTKCPHARRMASLAALEAEKGALSQEIILTLGNYYQSFSAARATLHPDAKMCRGDPAAKVTVIEFFDYECPGCGAARPVLEAFAKGKPGVRFCVLPFPLTAHPNAMPAGQAALFARDHGKFWAMHDLLFENQRRLNPEVILELATQAGLSSVELRKAMDGGKYLDELKATRDAGIRGGVDSTPSVFFNGRKFGLPLLPEMLVHAAEDELEWMTHQNAWASD